MNQRRAISLVIIFYCAVSIGLLSPFLFGGKALFVADITYNVEPGARFISEFWQQHNKFALWNPWVLNGVPQIAVIWPNFYLPAMIGLCLPFGLGSGLLMLMHLLLAGIGGFFWQLKSHRFQPTSFMAAAFFGLAYMLCGYMFGCPINLGLMVSAAWIPSTLMALDMICLSPKWWHCGVLSLLLGMQFSAGRPEIAVAACLLYLMYFISNLGSWRPRAPFMVASAFVLGSAFAAPEYIPLIELVSNSPAALQFSVLKSTFWSAGFLDWLSLLVMQPLGRMNMASPSEFVTYPGSLPYVTSLFVGAPVLTLAVLSLAKNWKRSLPWIVLIVLSILVALGQFGPFAAALDGQNVVRYPIKLAIFALFGLLVMAANGWRSVFTGIVTRLNILTSMLFWLLIIAAVAVVNVNVQTLADYQHVLLKGIFFAAISGLIAAGLILLKNRFSEITLLAFIAIVFVLNDRTLLAPLAPSRFYEQPSSVAQLIKSHCQLGTRNFRILPLIDNTILPPKQFDAVTDSELDEKFSAYCREILRPNTNIDAHIQSTNGVSVIPTWNSLFIDTGLLPRSTLSPTTHPLGKSDLPLYRYCQATSTAYVETLKDTQNANGEWVPTPSLDSSFFQLLKEDDALNIRLYTIVHIRPRVSIVRNIRFMPTRDAALKYINRADTNGFDPLREVTIVGAPPKEVAGVAPTESLSDYAMVDIDQNEYVRISANTSVQSALVLTDGFYPGWEAFDNGKPTEIYIADGVVRAVIIQPGQHRIVFRYRPSSWFAGLALMFVSITTAGFMLLSRFVKVNPSW